MRMKINTWDNHSLQDSSYIAMNPLGVGNGMATATANYIDVGISDPILAGKTLAGSYFTFQVKLLGTTDATLESQRDVLNGWFMPNDFTLRKLVGLDIDNSDKDWYLEGFPVSPPMMVPGSVKNLFNITLALSSPYWIENDLNTSTWAITAATDTKVVTAVGNVPALPTFAITPNTAKTGGAGSGWLQKHFVAVHTSGWGMSRLSVDVTAGGWDTATLVTGSKMQADGDDLRVFVDGVDSMRWFGIAAGAMNTAATKVWITLNLTPQPTLALATTLNNSTMPATINVGYTDAGISLPQNSTLLIGSELFSYSSYTVNATSKVITFTLVERNAKDSTIAAHAITDRVYWIEHEIWVLFDNATATAPTYKSTGGYILTYTPFFDLDLSTNSSFVYDTFGDASSKAVNPMQPVRSGTVNYLNNFWVFDGNYLIDAVGVGNALQGFDFRYNNTFPFTAWGFYHAGGISNIEGNGSKVSYTLDVVWPTSVVITDRNDGLGSVLYNITAPAGDGNPVAVTFDVACSSNNVYLYCTGMQNPQPMCSAQITDCILTIADPPSLTVIAPKVNYTIEGSLKNNTTAETVVFNGVATKTTLTLTIDCDNQEVYNEDGKRVRGMISFNGEKRDEWMTLRNGANTLAWADVGTSDVTIVTTWRGRNTI